MIHLNITKADSTKWMREFNTLEESNNYLTALNDFNEWGHKDVYLTEREALKLGYHLHDSKGVSDDIFLGMPIVKYLYLQNYTAIATEYVIPYQELRQKEYVKEGCTESAKNEALWDLIVEKDSTKADVLQTKRLAVKAKVPKTKV